MRLAIFRRRSHSEHGAGLVSVRDEPVGREYVKNLQMVGQGCFLYLKKITVYGVAFAHSRTMT